MKKSYTTLQVVLIVLSCVLGVACFVGNAGILILDENASGKWIFRLNLLISAVFAGVFLLLIRHPEKTQVFGDQPEDQSDPAPALCATRTYLCFLAFDTAAVLSFVLIGGQIFKDPELAVIILSVGIFLIAVGKYLYDIGKIGVADEEWTEPAPEQPIRIPVQKESPENKTE